MIDGRCQDSCGLSNTYNFSDTCYNCSDSCNECRAGTNSDCINCASGYYNVSNSCITPCPTGSVPQGETCGCSSDCNTCEGIESNCTSCADTSHLLYSGQCITDCPLSTYIYINTCEDCVSGCQTCIRSGCQECLTGYNIYDGACYS